MATTTRKTVRLGLAGCGTVGSGVVGLLAQRHDDIAARTGVDLQIACVAVRDPGRSRGVGLLAQVLTSDPRALLASGIDIVVEVIGGCGTARDIVLSAIRAGKHVVTANKALIALHGAEIFAAARQAGVAVGIEASCCGGLPIVSAIQRGLVANRINALYGIVNGTCNYILTEMLDSGRLYEDVLAEAQSLGYAEPDPTMDVNGTDSAHKLAILASLAFGTHVDFDRVHTEGIKQIELTDLQAGYEQGYVCKLLAVARRQDEGITLQVGPAFLDQSHPLAHVRGPFNAVSLYGHAVGHTLHYGRGAGADPTASAVLSDVVEIASGNAAPAPFPAPTSDPKDPIYRSLHDLRSRYYIRLLVQDRPGVIADVTRALADQQISLSAITQRDPHDETCQQVVTVVVITHLAREGDLRAALRAIERIPTVTRPPVAIRIVEEREEF